MLMMLAGTNYRFAKHGLSGAEMSELLPHLSTVADDICLLKGLHTNEINHAPAQMFLHTGFGQGGRPSLGAWVTYGLGTENRDLPAYVVLPGGFGTLDELFEALTLMQTGKVPYGPVILVGSAFWGGLMSWIEEQLTGNGLINAIDPKTFFISFRAASTVTLKSSKAFLTAVRRVSASAFTCSTPSRSACL